MAAARSAISSPLLEASIEGARGILMTITGPSDVGLFEVNEAAEIIAQAAHPDALDGDIAQVLAGLHVG